MEITNFITPEGSRYLVFISDGYIRDTQYYCGSTADEPGLDDQLADDGNWYDISGMLLVMDFDAKDSTEAKVRIKEEFPDASPDIFTVLKVTAQEVPLIE